MQARGGPRSAIQIAMPKPCLIGLLLLAASSATPAQAQDSTAKSAFAGFEGLPEVGRYLTYFTGPARARMAEWLARGSQYRPAIESKLTRAGLPPEFAYLPIIESGFSNSAVSRTGAVGMWQFMPETARELGLRVDPLVDERRDPTRSTDAAIRHLGDLTRTFGSPLLAAAAYNGGAGRVNRGLEKLSGANPNFFALADRKLLPKETRDYVPQLLAAAAIGRDPGRFGFSVPGLAAPPVDATQVDRPIGASQSERLAELPAVRVGGGFAQKMDRLGAIVRVKRGDTVSDLAARHGVSEARLRRLNALPMWYQLKPGQALRLPAA